MNSKLLLGFLLCWTLTISLAQNPKRSDVVYISNQWKIKGWLYEPQPNNGSLPAIIMGTGFGGTKECTYDQSAEDFAKAGFAVLLFDNPHFGESEGLPRQEVEPWEQIAAYRDGISYLCSLLQIDKNRIGCWGGSFSGAHSVVVTALDKRVKCAISMTPPVGNDNRLKKMPEAMKKAMFNQFDADRQNRFGGGSPSMLPTTAASSKEPAAIPGLNTWNFYQFIKNNSPRIINQVTLRSLENMLSYEPFAYINRIGSTPILFMLTTKEELTDNRQIEAAYQGLEGVKDLKYIEGHHFSPYMEKRQEANQMAIDWFKKYL